ncbi:MAG: hypothetical protein ACM3QX_05045 [Syntrophomonadaceae bacterium]
MFTRSKMPAIRTVHPNLFQGFSFTSIVLPVAVGMVLAGYSKK